MNKNILVEEDSTLKDDPSYSTNKGVVKKTHVYKTASQIGAESKADTKEMVTPMAGNLSSDEDPDYCEDSIKNMQNQLITALQAQRDKASSKLKKIEKEKSDFQSKLEEEKV